jgi:hypothetical protein
MKVIGKLNGENGYPERAACRTENEMQTREDLVELARACLKQARVSKNPVVVAEFTHLAKGCIFASAYRRHHPMVISTT